MNIKYFYGRKRRGRGEEEEEERKRKENRCSKFKNRTNVLIPKNRTNELIPKNRTYVLNLAFSDLSTIFAGQI